MPTPLASDFTRILQVWTLSDGKSATEAFFVHGATEPNLTELQDMADAAASVFPGDALEAQISTQTALDHCEAQRWNFSTGPNPIVPTTVAFNSTAAANPGTGAGEQMPSQCAIVTTLRTALPGRSFRGRVYSPPPQESASSANRISTSLAAIYNDYIQAVATAVLAVAPPDNEVVVVSRTLGVASLVIAFTTGTAVDTQRRRAIRD